MHANRTLMSSLRMISFIKRSEWKNGDSSPFASGARFVYQFYVICFLMNGLELNE